MTTSFGVDTAYSAISDYYLALAPNCDDTIFGTNVNYCNLVKTGIVDGQENDPAIVYGFENYTKGVQKSFDKATKHLSQVAEQPVTVLSILTDNPETSLFKQLCDLTGWSEYLKATRDLTVFVPTNNSLQNALNTWLSIGDTSTVKEVLKAHTLKYNLIYPDLQNKLLKLNTAKEGFTFYIDDTNRHTPYTNVYTKSYHFNNFTYPLPEVRIPLLKAFTTNGGWGQAHLSANGTVNSNATIYIIDGIFKPISI
jgi:uncharacterized surface protein with fasciclin (FAS1) repeats